MTETFKSSDGDIRAVMHTMIYSPEFWTREAYRAKIKTPFEFVASSVRVLGTEVDTPMPLVQWVGRIGEPLYRIRSTAGIRTTNVAYGGEDRRTLYITESEHGAILRVRLAVPGRAMYSHTGPDRIQQEERS